MLIRCLPLCLVILMLMPGMAIAADISAPKRLELYNIHNHETIDVVFWENGAFVPEALEKLNYILRDRRNEEVTQMDPQLFLLVHRIYKKVGGVGPIHIISGYRSKESNDKMKSEGRHVAKKSQHSLGKAMDIQIQNVSPKVVRGVALGMKAGGVGYYSADGFVHIDTGRPRSW